MLSHYPSLIFQVPKPSPVELLLNGRPAPTPTCKPARASKFTTSLAVKMSASQRSFTTADVIKHRPRDDICLIDADADAAIKAAWLAHEPDQRLLTGTVTPVS